MTAPFLVSTDLDGTLLDHHTYSFAAAMPSITRLIQLGVSIVINTSKTFAEVARLQQQLGFDAAFIVENGSAAYLPKSLEHASIAKHYNSEFNRLVFGIQRSDIVGFLHSLRASCAWKFQGYADWSHYEIREHTGLSLEDAQHSQQREFSEPIVWQDSADNFSKFVSAVEAEGFRVLRGGRFIHILGQSNKGSALLELRSIMFPNQSLPLLCLGDSHNDIDMLRIADYPVWVRSPAHAFPEIETDKTVFYTERYGPEGWHEAISALLATVGEPHG